VHDVLSVQQSYQIDLWLHLPSPLGIGAGQTTVQSVYEDLRVFSRLKTPIVSLSALVDPTGEGTPLTTLAMLVAAPLGHRSWGRDVRRESRLVARVMRSASRRHLSSAARNPCRATRLLTELAQVSEAVGPRFRHLADQLRTRGLDGPTTLCLDASDEYLSVQIEQLCTRAVAMLERHTPDPALQARLVAVARREAQHRHDQGWRTCLPKDHQHHHQADFLDQVGLLKRYIERVLILKPVPTQTHDMARNAMLGLAAALAMSWAVGLQVFALYSLGLNLSSGASTSIVVAFSTIAVLGYILKDRIKAWSADVLARQLPRFIDDRGSTLTWGLFATPLGRTSERVTFEAAHTLDPEIHQRHIAAMRTPLAAEVYDDVLHYRRRITLRPRAALAEFPRFAGVNEALRINVARWVRTLSAPRRTIAVLDDGGHATTRKLPNTYGVPVVVRVRSRDAKGHQQQIWSVHRIVLSQQGIERVEDLNDQPTRDSNEPGAFV